MKIVIIEDEHLAARRLEDLIRKKWPDARLMAKLASVRKSVEWFCNQQQPDLLFCDIQLSDGLSFEIFEKTEITCPVIFTTAYNEYALKAFKLNSIDYLLKPVDYEELSAALDKYGKIYQANGSVMAFEPFKLEDLRKLLAPEYKERFVVKVGPHLRPIEISEIQYFYSLEKATFLFTEQNKNYSLDYSLDQLEQQVDPKKFFRINRKYLIHIAAIKQVVSYSNSRLMVQFKNSLADDAIVSREKVQAFRNWME
jgi:two-component system, LytTR family, response regulator